MKLAIVGLERSGKTTVFDALTGSLKEVGTYGKTQVNIAMVKVPDERVEWLSKLYKPKKTIHADIEFIDIPGSINDSSDPKIIAVARESDALVYVIRAFRNANVPHPLETINPVRDFGQISTGLLVADISLAEKRIEKLKASIQKHSDKEKEERIELAGLEKVMEKLEAEHLASEADLTETEEKAIRSFQFLTLKPHLALLNVSEDKLKSEETERIVKEIPDCMAICANIEMEIERLDEKDRAAFLEDLGITEFSLNPFIRKAYEILGLVTFFTVGDEEVRARTIKRGTSALTAAGKVHSDLERGFIRAEVFSFSDVKELESEKEVKNAGKLRVEGKDYIVQDGDIVRIKFNV